MNRPLTIEEIMELAHLLSERLSPTDKWVVEFNRVLEMYNNAAEQFNSIRVDPMNDKSIAAYREANTRCALLQDTLSTLVRYFDKVQKYLQ